MKTRATFSGILAAASAALTLAAPHAIAQDNKPTEPASNKAVYDDYYESVEAANAENRQNLAEIDARYSAALKKYSDENVRRAQALPEANRAAHEALAQKGLAGAERQAEYDKIQSEDKQRRQEFAAWRETTTQKLQEEYAAAREEQLDKHKQRMDELLAVRNANLARFRAADSAAGLAPGTSAAIGGASGPDSGGSGSAPSAVQADGGMPGAAAGAAGVGAAGGKPEAAPAAKSPATAAGGISTSPGQDGGQGVNAPVRDESGEYFEYEDGSLIRAAPDGGDAGKVNDKGDIVYGDGTTVVNNGKGEVVIHRPDGSSTTRQRDADGTWQTTGRTAPSSNSANMPRHDAPGKSYVYGDGTRVFSIDKNGDLGKVNDKGDIVFGDGTTIVHTGEGQVVVHRPDGTARTQEVNEDGQWETVGYHKPSSEGSGSNDKYGPSTAGRGESSGSASGGSGGSSSSNSGSNADDSNDSDDGGKDNKDTKDSSGNDSDESGSAEGESGDGESSDSSDDADTKGKGKEYYGETGGGRSRGPSDVVQGIVDRATGQSTDVETGVPQPCGESGGFGVTQPVPGGAGNCIPGNLPTVSEENDQQPDTPDAGLSADAEDVRRAGQNDIAGRVTQPGIEGEGIPVEDLPSQSALDQSPVVNPPPGD